MEMEQLDVLSQHQEQYQQENKRQKSAYKEQPKKLSEEQEQY